MIEVGFPVGGTEKFISYIQNIGPPVSEVVRFHSRPRTDEAGRITVRLPKAWEECHEALCELEQVRASSRALSVALAAGMQGTQPLAPSYDQNVGGQGDGKGKNGKGKKTDGKGKPFIDHPPDAHRSAFRCEPPASATRLVVATATISTATISGTQDARTVVP